mmetsp:Transcript_15251/g.23226  ORF Transcript_15251/g.23226 Transcript_15251/m.23226 type:complete len:177 (-) Transcript_15251:1434-1964(-)|eukprot:CAMPEP_0178906762 /NCGR_PEP_ID=MMETSP0786-20121207/6999_1 /TAXON_ID=186022 /ORGANISM="Thalassionema frauenfeldii, Strain CCMP 1798" /LENGTH=176 /DNA_ID=CAMNT_0020578493 /DNA_START=153 /DNA_END=683 /DNA_ORIENTATION=-
MNNNSKKIKAAHKCWICDLETLKQPIRVEILGLIIKLNSKEMQVEDGTGSIVVGIEGHDIKGKIGENVKFSFFYGGNTINNECYFVADTVTWKVSPQAETLFQWNIIAPPGALGYPKLEFTKHDALRYIQHAGGGVKLEDLALVVDMSAETLLPYIHELQNDAFIYQNGDGEYVLL